MSAESPDAGHGADHPVVTAFLERLAADRAAGADHPLAHYQGLYPGFEDAIAREWEALEAPEDTDPDSITQAITVRSAQTTPAIGPYRAIAPLGEGGFGVVWLAEDTRLGRRVALKILRRAGLGAEATLQRFRREAETASRLDHPAICTVYETGEQDGCAYIAMRFVEGRTLSELIREANARGRGAAVALGDAAPQASGSDTVAEDATSSSRGQVLRIAAFFEEVCRAVHVAHEARVVHRDIKPGNIMVTPEGQPVVLDFGIARDVDDETLTQPWEMLGTLGYMSPEQIDRDPPLDRRADLWSLGVTLYESLTGRRPFQGASAARLAEAVRNREPPNPRRFNRAIPRDLAVVIATALEKDRGRRYATALDMADDLRRVRERRPIAARPAGVVMRIARWAQREPALAALVFVVGLVVPAVAAYRIGEQSTLEAGRRAQHRESFEHLVEDGFGELGNFKNYDALLKFEAALELEPASVEALTGKCLALMRDKRKDEAARFLEEREELTEASPILRLLRIQATDPLGTDSPELAKEAASLAASTDPFRSWFAGFLALQRSHLDVEGGKEALAHATRAIVLAKTARPLFHFLRAEAAGRAGDATAARESAEALCALWPERAASWFFGGFAIGMAGDPKAALPYLQRAVELGPDHILARSTLGAAHVALGDLEKARAEFEAILQRDPTDMNAHFYLADFDFEAGDHRAGALHLERGLDRDPGYIEKRLRLVTAWLDAGEPVRALDAAHTAVRAAKPADLRPQASLAQALVANEKADEAREVAQRALKSPEAEGEDEEQAAARVELKRILRAIEKEEEKD